MPESPTFCVLPWIHSCITTDGLAGLCCVAPESLLAADGAGLKVQSHTLSEIFHSPTMDRVRRAMLDVQPVKECSVCYDVEGRGAWSLRQEYNHFWSVTAPSLLARIDQQEEKAAFDKPLSADIKFGNLCNLRCQICNPHNSTEVERDPVLSKWALAHRYKMNGRFEGEWYEAPEFEAEVIEFSSDLQFINLAGGEPSMSKPAHRWLSSLVESGQAAKIELRVSTNLTNTNPYFLDLVSQFGTPILFLSIDGFGPLSDYLRYPSHWRIIERNAHYLAELSKRGGMRICVTPVISAYNALSIVHLFEWAVSFGFDIIAQHVRGVDPIDCALIPDKARQLVVQRMRDFLLQSGERVLNRATIEALCTYLEAPVDPAYAASCLEKFHAFTREVDGDRGMRFEMFAPEMAAFLGYSE